jgi:hypothetical protein
MDPNPNIPNTESILEMQITVLRDHLSALENILAHIRRARELQEG